MKTIVKNYNEVKAHIKVIPLSTVKKLYQNQRRFEWNDEVWIAKADKIDPVESTT